MSKYGVLFRMGIQTVLTYRFNVVLMMISIGVSVLLQLVLWRAVYSQSTTPTVYGFTFHQMVTYVVLGNVVPKITRASFEYEMANDVKMGGISRFLVAPISYFGYRLSVFLGANAISVMLALVVILALPFVGLSLSGAQSDIVRTLAFVSSLGLALVLNFLFFFLIGLASFWSVEAWGVFEAARILLLILSGGIFPLEVFGSFWQSVSAWLPFQYVVYFPIQVIDGRLAILAVGRGLVIQVLWILLLGVLALGSWKRATRRLVAVGG